MSFAERKKIALGKFERDLREGKVDSKMIHTLELINSLEHFYSLSSCAGRISLIKFSKDFRKQRGSVLHKWHEPVEAGEVLSRIEELLGKVENLMLCLEGAILHLSSNDLKLASKLMNQARNVGFKKGGIISMRGDEVILQLESTERLIVPIIVNSELIADRKLILKVVELANLLLERTHRKIEKLNQILEGLK